MVSIGFSAFQECSGLKSITIPNSVTTIGDHAFWDCSGLESITIPNNVTYIGNGAFFGCSGLKSIIIPYSVIFIGNYAFNYCSGLESINVESGNKMYDSRNNSNAVIETSSNELIVGCKKTTIPSGVVSIGYNAFKGCIGLESVIFPNSVTSIGNDAFFGCSGLTSVIIGGGVTSIDRVFDSCDNLEEIIMPQAVYESGFPASVTNFTTYSKKPMRVVVTSKSPTSATMTLYPIDEKGNIDESRKYYVTTIGQVIGEYTKWRLDDENYGIISEIFELPLVLETLPAQPTSTTKARLSALANAEDDDLHFGFEWMRNNAPEGMVPNKVSAPLYDGNIIGTLSGLNPDVYYKYRAYYESDDGDMVYGDWAIFITGDATVYFEPVVVTREIAAVTASSAQLSGIIIEGTDDIVEKGFEYWVISGTKTRSVGSDVKKVILSGNQTSVTIDGLEARTEYGYRSYVTTTSGTTYGEEKTFKTILMGDANSDGEVDERDVQAIANHIMGDTPDDFDEEAADLNGDDKIDVVDVVLLNQLLGEKPSS